MNGDSDNPFAQLLAEAPKDIDTRLLSAKSLSSSPQRQSSQFFDIEGHSASEESPIIVFDGKSEDEETAVGLQVRQPSFVSLCGQIIPKGSDSLADFTPILEEIKPLPSVEDEEDSTEEDDDQQVLFVKELKSKNANRWKEMGYEPPNDLIPLVRAASHTLITNKLLKSQNQSALASVSQYNFNVNLKPIKEEDNGEQVYSPVTIPRSGSFGMKKGEADKRNSLINIILNDINECEKYKHEEEYYEYEYNEEEEIYIYEEEEINEQNSETKDREINVEEEEINEQNSETKDREINVEEEEINEQNSEIKDREFNAEEESQISESAKSYEYKEEENENEQLPYNLDQVVDDKQRENEALMYALKKCVIKSKDNKLELHKELRLLLTKCSNLFMIDEAEYLSKVMKSAEKVTPPSPRIVSEGRNNEINREIHEVECEYQETVQRIEEEHRDTIDKEIALYKKKTEKLDKKFSNEKELEKFAKPSKELLNIRMQAKNAIRQKRFIDAKRLTNQAAYIEKIDSENAHKNIYKKYHEQDCIIKSEFAQRMSVVDSKFNYKKSKVDEEYNAKLKQLENTSKKVALQESITFGKQKAIKARKDAIERVEQKEIDNEIQSNSVKDEPSKAKTVRSPKKSLFLETGKLTVKPPTLLRRDNDFEIIQNMSIQLKSGRKKKDLSVQDAFAATQKKKATTK